MITLASIHSLAQTGINPASDDEISHDSEKCGLAASQHVQLHRFERDGAHRIDERFELDKFGHKTHQLTCRLLLKTWTRRL